MPVWFALTATISYNVRRHLRGKSTLCSTARRHVPAPLVDVGLLGLAAYMHFHYRKDNR